ncbi:MAG: hypothetical protein HZC10_04240 [Nitrospirae bacterium]|nr:hypothetical protein [Nitrospirota bacterium]
MSILIKKIAGKKYAYLAYRINKKVVHKYLGPASNKEVISKIAELKLEKKVPKRYYPFFWDASPREIDLKRNSRYIIERVLEMGDLNVLQWIQRIYPTRMIIEICKESRKLSAKSRNFWEIWFGVQNPH